MGNAGAQMEGQTPMTIRSTDFTEGGAIPKRCACDGENKNPQLHFDQIPSAAKSLVLIVEDPDAPKGTLMHWVIWNLKPDVKEILAGSPPQDAVQGVNYKGENSYTGPCPPAGTHRYHFRLFALDTMLRLPAKSDGKAVEKAIEGHVLAKAELVGTYAHGGAQY
ncbi:MAG TPA: YbhB/YbcL family Raf kinase inhibitor-like protein [Chthoniobacteraceae bacterium]|nr:YbhB/YbcL family Raf kinase inhibitor-like protein [Chthoniobacteraceae bacterium]